MAMSTIEPIKVQMMKLENGNAYFKLRDNVTSTIKHNELLGTDFNFFTYDEFDLQITYVENIEQLITDNFATYWTLANEQLASKKALEEKKQQMKDWIDNGKYGLIAVNEQTKEDLNTLILGLMDAYEQILTLSTT